MSQYKGDFDNLSRTKPLIRTVSNLKGVTNNLRTFANSLEQLLDSIENFAPTIEMVAKGKDTLVSMIAASRRPMRPMQKKVEQKKPESIDIEEEVSEDNLN